MTDAELDSIERWLERVECGRTKNRAWAGKGADASSVTALALQHAGAMAAEVRRCHQLLDAAGVGRDVNAGKQDGSAWLYRSVEVGPHGGRRVREWWGEGPTGDEEGA